MHVHKTHPQREPPQEEKWESIADKLALVLMQNGVGGRQFDAIRARYKAKKAIPFPNQVKTEEP